MPQMAPLSWLTLFIIFSFTLILFNMLNYFNYSPRSPASFSRRSSQTKPFNWPW
uniref:ATP synthase complex subunit 8 n=1 Tax=Rhoenanthus obscurus TaxID=2850857 RepID=A0AAU7YQW1_9INSE